MASLKLKRKMEIKNFRKTFENEADKKRRPSRTVVRAMKRKQAQDKGKEKKGKGKGKEKKGRDEKKNE